MRLFCRHIPPHNGRWNLALHKQEKSTNTKNAAIPFECQQREVRQRVFKARPPHSCSWWRQVEGTAELEADRVFLYIHFYSHVQTEGTPRIQRPRKLVVSKSSRCPTPMGIAQKRVENGGFNTMEKRVIAWAEKVGAGYLGTCLCLMEHKCAVFASTSEKPVTMFHHALLYLNFHMLTVANEKLRGECEMKIEGRCQTNY